MAEGKQRSFTSTASLFALASCSFCSFLHLTSSSFLHLASSLFLCLSAGSSASLISFSSCWAILCYSLNFFTLLKTFPSACCMASHALALTRNSLSTSTSCTLHMSCASAILLSSAVMCQALDLLSCLLVSFLLFSKRQLCRCRFSASISLFDA